MLSGVGVVYYRYKYHNAVYQSINHMYMIQGDNGTWNLRNGALALAPKKECFYAGILKYSGNKAINNGTLSVKFVIKSRKTNKVTSTVFSKIKAGVNISNGTEISLGEKIKSLSKAKKYNFQKTNDFYLDLRYTSTSKIPINEEIKLNIVSFKLK
jgi:hypothetical protein